MTDSDPVIAEIDLDNLPDHGVFVDIHLSDAPKVADLLEAAKDYVQRWHESAPGHGWGTFDNPWVERFRAAIRAIEPEWTP